jgi:hypothetical protein
MRERTTRPLTKLPEGIPFDFRERDLSPPAVVRLALRAVGVVVDLFTIVSAPVSLDT